MRHTALIIVRYMLSSQNRAKVD